MPYDWLRHISFAEPLALLLLALPVWLLVDYVRNQPRREGFLLISTTRHLGESHGWRSAARHLLLALRVLALMALVLAIARPRTRNDIRVVRGEGIDIILCMDVSGSMLTQDFRPNRLEAMKRVAMEFVDRRPGDRIGLVVFAGESFSVSPLTMDRETLKFQIRQAQTGLLADGTAIGDGLATAVERLRHSQSASRVVILLTDGENQGGLLDPATASEIASTMGIRVYTIGMATEETHPTPTAGSSGALVGRRDRTHLNEEMLRQIAAETGGLYFRARDDQGLQRIYAEIDRLEKSEVELVEIRRYTERFRPFVWLALGLLLAEILLRATLIRKFP